MALPAELRNMIYERTLGGRKQQIFLPSRYRGECVYWDEPTLLGVSKSIRAEALRMHYGLKSIIVRIELGKDNLERPLAYINAINNYSGRSNVFGELHIFFERAHWGGLHKYKPIVDFLRTTSIGFTEIDTEELHDILRTKQDQGSKFTMCSTGKFKQLRLVVSKLIKIGLEAKREDWDENKLQSEFDTRVSQLEESTSYSLELTRARHDGRKTTFQVNKERKREERAELLEAQRMAQPWQPDFATSYNSHRSAVPAPSLRMMGITVQAPQAPQLPQRHSSIEEITAPAPYLQHGVVPNSHPVYQHNLPMRRVPMQQRASTLPRPLGQGLLLRLSNLTDDLLNWLSNIGEPYRALQFLHMYFIEDPASAIGLSELWNAYYHPFAEFHHLHPLLPPNLFVPQAKKIFPSARLQHDASGKYVIRGIGLRDAPVGPS